MARLTRADLPRVFVHQPDGIILEIRVSEISHVQEYGRSAWEHRVSIEGFLIDTDVMKSGAFPTQTYPVAGKGADPINIGGEPEECILRCSACGFTDSESTHVCSV